MQKFVIWYSVGEYDDARDYTVPFVYESKESLTSIIKELGQRYIDEHDEHKEKVDALIERRRAGEIDFDEFDRLKAEITEDPYIIESDGYKLQVVDFIYESYPRTGKKTIIMPSIYHLDEWFENRDHM